MVAALTPTSNASATFAQVRKDITTIHSEFSAVRQDFTQMKQDAKNIKSATPTPAATPTP
jgi:hypothetical protein